MSDDDVLDLAALRRNFDDDMQFVARLMGKFEMRCPAQMKELGEALARHEPSEAAELAHRIAGETGVFYATTARRTALELEEFARAARFAEADEAYDVLRREIERLIAAVHALPDPSTPGNSAPA